MTTSDHPAYEGYPAAGTILRVNVSRYDAAEVPWDKSDHPDCRALLPTHGHVNGLLVSVLDDEALLRRVIYQYDSLLDECEDDDYETHINGIDLSSYRIADVRLVSPIDSHLKHLHFWLRDDCFEPVGALELLATSDLIPD